EMYETLINPQQYDRIVPGRALNLNQLRDLQTLCEAFRIRTPKQWTVMAQKRAIEQLGQCGLRQRDQLSSFVIKLKDQEETEEDQEDRDRMGGPGEGRARAAIV